MTTSPVPGARLPAVVRALAGASVLVVLAVSYAEQRAAGRGSVVDFLGYFTNLTSLLAGLLLVVLAVHAGRPAPLWLTLARGVATTCLVVVAVVYATLVPGEGGTTPWVSAVLHVAFPCAVVLDWLVLADRPALPWRRLWLVLPYPVLWLVVAVVRGRTDGWVPYGFLLPGRGVPSLVLHVAGLVVVLLAAGALVWATGRTRGLRRPVAPAAV
ncbi:Pr6Pr family membrane protein [Cellulomonas xiejunii]|uniref:Pr6Pr family membrane protein n=1 Tax=Cellulomonas xiejunii TaxID=2968083 RepID=UPI001D0E8CB1|nr:Pr6Pr family membrane protein [Cellulomonas xiejunii]MCC2313979.1 Pr6Pr family membrane protein [Cellulomonas xiejunii]